MNAMSTDRERAWAACDARCEELRGKALWSGHGYDVKNVLHLAFDDFAKHWLPSEGHDFSFYDDTDTTMLQRWVGRYLDAAGLVVQGTPSPTGDACD